MEAISVTARFEPDGQVQPLTFRWHERDYRVDSVGRRWEDEQGLHVLVMVTGERVFELVFVTGDQRWYLKKIGRGQALA